MEQVRKQKRASARTQEAQVETVAAEPSEVAALTDELLDEIDSVLEQNAAEFVREYIQKGGQ